MERQRQRNTGKRGDNKPTQHGWDGEGQAPVGTGAAQFGGHLPYGKCSCNNGWPAAAKSEAVGA